MWTRAELKDRAKFAFKRNYWRSVLISLLLALLIGGGSGAGSAGSAMSSALGSDGSDITSDSYDDFYDDADDIWYGMNDVYSTSFCRSHFCCDLHDCICDHYDCYNSFGCIYF